MSARPPLARHRTSHRELIAMQAPGAPPHHSRLGRLARGAGRPAPRAAEPSEVCELCAQPVGPEHRHLLDLEGQRLLCACQACTILFDRRVAGGKHYRLVPDRCRFVEDFALPDAVWERLAIPVELAFIFEHTPAARVAAFYPSPAGATESLLALTTWAEIAAANPVVASMEPDVEALLVNRAHGAREHWIVPVDECYRLVGIIRMHWRGLSGGEEVWREIAAFFDALRRRSAVVHRSGDPIARVGAGGHEASGAHH